MLLFLALTRQEFRHVSYSQVLLQNAVPLLQPVNSKSADMLRLLIQHGADITASNGMVSVIPVQQSKHACNIICSVQHFVCIGANTRCLQCSGLVLGNSSSLITCPCAMHCRMSVYHYVCVVMG